MLSYPPDMVEKTEAAIRGNGQAAGYLFEWFRAPLLAHALAICGNTPAAQDALQDTFITALTKLPTLRDTAMVYPWLRAILLRKCYRMAAREGITSLDDMTKQGDAVVRNTVEEQIESTGCSQQLYDVLQGLSEELRSCVMLRYFTQFNSYADIALLLNVPIGTVRSRLSAAREKMKALYPASDDADGMALRLAKEWSARYTRYWTDMYDDMPTRDQLLRHIAPHTVLRFTSGKTCSDAQAVVAKELDADLRCGTFFRLNEVHSCGDISVIEGPNVNSPEHPDRCAPSSVFIAFRQKGKIVRLHLFDSPR